MNLEIVEISPYKYGVVNVNDYNTFHYNIDNFVETVMTYDEKHKTNESYSNLIYIESKNEKTLNDISKLIKVMATRSMKLDEAISGELKKDKGGNFIMKDEELY